MANQNKDNERQRQGQAQQPDPNQQKGGQKGGQIQQDQDPDRQRQGNQGQQKGMDQDRQNMRDQGPQHERSDRDIARDIDQDIARDIDRDIDDVQSVSGQQQDRSKQFEQGQRGPQLDEVKGGDKQVNRDEDVDQDRITQKKPQQGGPANKPNKQ